MNYPSYISMKQNYTQRNLSKVTSNIVAAKTGQAILTIFCCSNIATNLIFLLQ